MTTCQMSTEVAVPMMKQPIRGRAAADQATQCRAWSTFCFRASFQSAANFRLLRGPLPVKKAQAARTRSFVRALTACRSKPAWWGTYTGQARSHPWAAFSPGGGSLMSSPAAMRAGVAT